MKETNTVAMGSIHLVWIRNVVVFMVFLNTVTGEANPWIYTGESLNGRETRSLDDGSVNSSEPRSLAFIFDVTSSMKDDWKGAMSGGKQILTEFLSYKTRPIKNFILVPFRDPAVGPLTSTEDSDEFLANLKKLRIYGGGDCPEMSVTGIIQALEAAYPNSYLYVFTDASAKDFDRLDEALKLIQRKHAQVVFLITGDCGTPHKEDFFVYEKIASASYGQIYYVLKKNVGDVLKSALITTQPNKNNLLVVSNPELDPHNSVKYDLSVEKDLKEMIVEVGGAFPEIDIRNPLGNKPENITIPFDLPNNKFIVIDHPEPAGNWVLKVTFHPEKEQNITVDKPLITVKGVGSAYEITYGFAVIPVDSLSGTAYRPLEKRENYIYMEVHPTEDTEENKDKLAKYKWENVDVMKSNGKPFFSLPLTPKAPGDGGNIFPMRFLAGPFTPPDSLFSLSFRGIDENKNPVTRLTSNYISAEQAGVPYVKMTSPDVFVIGKELKVTCEVESLIPFSLQWYKDGKPIGAKKDFPQSSGDSIIVANAKREDGGQYKCEATNFRGSDNKNETVTGIELPTVSAVIPYLAVKLNEDAILQCKVSGTPPPDISWTFKKNLLANGPKYQISSDGSSLKIIKSDLDDQGTYKCVAHGPRDFKTTAEIRFRIGRPPTAKRLYLNETIQVKHDGTFPCKSKSYPGDNLYPGMKPKMSWQRESGSLDLTRHKVLTSGELKINAAEISDKGLYICTLENDFGKTYMRLNLEVKGIIPPAIDKIKPENIHFVSGKTVVLFCNATGEPEPKIIWSFRKDDTVKPEELEDDPEDDSISIKGKKLTLYNAVKAIEGIYSCVADNGAGATPPKDYNLRMIDGPPVLSGDGKPTVAKVLSGADYTLDCSTGSTEDVSYRWIKDNKYSIDGRYPKYFTFSKDNSRLTIHSVIPRYHSGNYKCIAKNKVGRAEKTFSISVEKRKRRNNVI